MLNSTKTRFPAIRCSFPFQVLTTYTQLLAITTDTTQWQPNASEYFDQPNPIGSMEETFYQGTPTGHRKIAPGSEPALP